MALGELLNDIKDLEPKEFYEKVVERKFYVTDYKDIIYQIKAIHNKKTAIVWYDSKNNMDRVDTYSFEDIKKYFMNGTWLLVD